MIDPDPQSQTHDRSRSDSDPLQVAIPSRNPSNPLKTILPMSRPGKSEEFETKDFALQGGWVVTGVAAAAPNNCQGVLLNELQIIRRALIKFVLAKGEICATKCAISQPPKRETDTNGTSVANNATH